MSHKKRIIDEEIKDNVQMRSGFFELEKNEETNYQDLPEIKEGDSYGVTFGGGFPIESRNNKLNFKPQQNTEIKTDRFREFDSDFEENMLLNSYNWPKDTPV